MADEEEDVFLPRPGAGAGAGRAVADALNRPEVMAALLQFGLSSLSGRPFGHAVGEAGEAVGRFQEGEASAKKAKLAEDAAAQRLDLQQQRQDLREEEAAGRQGEREDRSRTRGLRGLLATRREDRMEAQGAGRGRMWADKAPAGTPVVQGGVTYIKQLDGSWKPKTSLQVQQPEEQPQSTEVASG